jgi:TonB family protein
MRWKLIAGTLALMIFAATGALAQDQPSSPQDSPTPQSSAPETSTQKSVADETPRSVRMVPKAAQASLIYQVPPVYPPIAKTAHISGTILLHCMIGKDGTVQEVQYVSGPPVLMKAAMDAVRQWKYKPTLIDGKPVQVDTTVGVVFALGGSPSSATSPQEIKPNPTDKYKAEGYVNDFADVIESGDRSQLDLICKDIDEKEDVQMAIVTIASLDGQPIKDFATQLANRWGVGYKETNRGILILLSVNDHQYRIATGRGLESVLTDEEADRLGREMVPMLQKGDYGKALLHLAKRIQVELPQKAE